MGLADSFPGVQSAREDWKVGKRLHGENCAELFGILEAESETRITRSPENLLSGKTFAQSEPDPTSAVAARHAAGHL